MMTKEQARELSIWIVAVLLLLLITTFFTADKTPSRYYVESPSVSNGTWCIYGDSAWYVDSIAFCSSDIEKVLQVNAALNRERTR